METKMKNRSVSRGVMTAMLLASVLVSTGTAWARDYEMPSPHPGGIDPNAYITNVAVGASATLVSWSYLQGPIQVEANTNLLTPWFAVSPLTDVLSGSYLVTNPASSGVSYRLTGPELKYMSVSAGCQACHPNLVSSWSRTPHASALGLLANINQATNSSCLPCHTVGYGYPSGYNATNRPYLAGVQCENCHGPVGGHAGVQFTPAVTLSAKMCGGCHNGSDPENHSIFQDWETAGHAEVVEDVGKDFTNSSLATAQGRMGNCGFCHSGAVRLALLKQEGALPTGPDAEEIGQTCVVCHDPHDPHPENGGFHLRNRLSSTNYYNFATSQTGQPAYGTNAVLNYAIAYSNFWAQYNPNVQICAQCHNARGATLASNSRPPHHSPQYNILLGNLGITTNTPPQGAHATACSNQCADCHMNLASLPGHTNAAEHTFAPNTNACAVCHVTDPETLIATTQAEVSNRLYAVAAQLKTWALTKASSTLSKYGANAWEFTTPGALSTTNSGPSSSDQKFVPLAIQQARFNAYLVLHDGSMGIHNTPYERYLLGVASNLVEGAVAGAGVVNAGFSGVSPASAANTADGVSTRTITVQARDANGKNVTSGGATVVFSQTLGTMGSTTDNTNGTYTAVWTAPSATNGSPALITATLDGTTVGTTIGATACVITLVGSVDASHSTVSPSSVTNTLDGVATRTITVQARDVRNNNRLSGGDTVVFSASAGSMGATTDSGTGTYTSVWTVPASLAVNPAVVTATLGGVPVGTAVSASGCVIRLIGPADASHSTLSPSVTTNAILAGLTNRTITVQARDVANNNRISGTNSVIFSATAGTLSTTKNNSNGTFTVTWTAPANLSTNPVVVTATLDGVPVGTAVGAASCVINLVGPADASHSTISPTASSQTAPGTNTLVVTVQARDVANNNRFSGGDVVVFSATAGTMSATTDSANGIYRATWSAPPHRAVNPAVVTATLGGVPIGTSVSASNCVITLTMP